MSFQASSAAGQLATGFWSRIAASCGQGGRPAGVWVTTAGAAGSAVDEKQVGVDSQGGIRQKREREVVRWALSSRWTASHSRARVSADGKRWMSKQGRTLGRRRAILEAEGRVHDG